MAHRQKGEFYSCIARSRHSNIERMTESFLDLIVTNATGLLILAVLCTIANPCYASFNDPPYDQRESKSKSLKVSLNRKNNIIRLYTSAVVAGCCQTGGYRRLVTVSQQVSK